MTEAQASEIARTLHLQWASRWVPSIKQARTIPIELLRRARHMAAAQFFCLLVDGLGIETGEDGIYYERVPQLLSLLGVQLVDEQIDRRDPQLGILFKELTVAILDGVEDAECPCFDLPFTPLDQISIQE